MRDAGQGVVLVSGEPELCVVGSRPELRAGAEGRDGWSYARGAGLAARERQSRGPGAAARKRARGTGEHAVLEGRCLRGKVEWQGRFIGRGVTGAASAAGARPRSDTAGLWWAAG